MEDVHNMIQETMPRRSPTEFWEDLFKVLPRRDRNAVRKFCRRRFHNFRSPGQWGDDDDRDLQEVYARHPGKWKEIAAIMNKRPDDVRDRWRNYVKYGDNRKVDHWAYYEEDALRNAVHECREALRKVQEEKLQQGKLHYSKVDDEDKLINWDVVSQKMGNSRSRLQCSTKWKQLLAKDRKERQTTSEAGHPVYKSQTKYEVAQESIKASRDWKKDRARKLYERMKSGDKYELLLQ
jgi:hypothetical protein